MHLFNPGSFIPEKQRLGMPVYVYLSVIINSCRAPLTLEDDMSYFPQEKI